jgi:NitT/TauT family transport system substrate-binding protein
MRDQRQSMNRREFVGGLTLATTAGVIRGRADAAAGEPPPETKTLKLAQRAVVCHAPVYISEPLLLGEGFTNVRWVKKLGGTYFQALNSGEIDLGLVFCAAMIERVDAGDGVVFVAGGHAGCQELLATKHIRNIKDLRGKKLAITAQGDAFHVQLSAMMAYVGVDPRKDVQWITHGEVSETEFIRSFIDRKVDACLISPPFAQEARAKKIGHVVVNTTLDRPWSQYFCCMVVANRRFAQAHPIATKRALRAILKANALCATEPDRVARALVDMGFTNQLEYAAQSMRDVPYAKWADYNAEDTVRFYALRLNEARMIKSSPQKIIAQGTDWRFINELNKELKS